MSDVITLAVEGMFDDIDSIYLRARLRESRSCKRCEGKGELPDRHFSMEGIAFRTIQCPDCEDA